MVIFSLNVRNGILAYWRSLYGYPITTRRAYEKYQGQQVYHSLFFDALEFLRQEILEVFYGKNAKKRRSIVLLRCGLGVKFNVRIAEIHRRIAPKWL